MKTLIWIAIILSFIAIIASLGCTELRAVMVNPFAPTEPIVRQKPRPFSDRIYCNKINLGWIHYYKGNYCGEDGLNYTSIVDACESNNYYFNETC